MAENKDAKCAALLPCPFCSAPASLNEAKTHARCSKCNTTPWLYTDDWNRRTPSAPIGEDGLPQLPTNVAHVTRRIRRCESDVPAQVVLEHFAMQFAREAVAADRRARGDAVDDLSMLVRQLVHSLKKANPNSGLPARAVDYLQRKGLAGSPLRSADPEALGEESPQAAHGVKTWCERMPEHVRQIGSAASQVAYMELEISDLRVQLAATSENLQTAVQEAWRANSELSKLRAAPPLSSEQQAEKGEIT